MQYHHCPDCETGWRYIDEIPVSLIPIEHRVRHGLVRCPTCAGTGKILPRRAA